MTWNLGAHELAVDFGEPGPVRPPGLPQGAAVIRLVRLKTVRPGP